MTDNRDNTSSIHEKLDPNTLSALEHAILHRTPPTFTACFEKFALADRGLSFSAFYRYARRLRDASRIAQIAELKGEDAASALTAVPHLVANQLVDALTVENPSSRTVARLANAYRNFTLAQVASRRLEFAEMDHTKTERIREIEEITDQVVRLKKLELAELKAELARIKVTGVPNAPEDGVRQGSPLSPDHCEPREPDRRGDSESGHRVRQGSVLSPDPSEPRPSDRRFAVAERGSPRQPTDSPQPVTSLKSVSSAQSVVSSPTAYSLQSATCLDSRIDAAIDARLPPSLKPDPSRRHDPSNGKKRKHRNLAPT